MMTTGAQRAQIVLSGENENQKLEWTNQISAKIQRMNFRCKILATPHSNPTASSKI